MKVLCAPASPAVPAIARALAGRGHVVEVVAAPDLPAHLRDGACDVVLMERPALPGLRAAAQVRGGAMPVIALLGEAGPAARVAALDAGAADALAQPVHAEELHARIVAQVRRAHGHAQPVLPFGPLVVDLRRRQALADGWPVPLSRMEFALLEALALRPGRMVPRSDLLSLLYAGPEAESAGSVTGMLVKLRAKLRGAPGGCPVETVHGRGFRLEMAGAPA